MQIGQNTQRQTECQGNGRSSRHDCNPARTPNPGSDLESLTLCCPMLVFFGPTLKAIWPVYISTFQAKGLSKRIRYSVHCWHCPNEGSPGNIKQGNNQQTTNNKKNVKCVGTVKKIIFFMPEFNEFKVGHTLGLTLA